MVKVYCFDFDGENELRRIGATWFVSYSYYTYVDRSHKSWEKVSTSYMRAINFRRTMKFHESWLRHILLMDDARLNTNTLGLSADETKRMAKTILNIVYDEGVDK